MAKIKGMLVAIGGAEDKGMDLPGKRRPKHRRDFFEAGILRQLLDLVMTHHAAPRIELITTASSIPDVVEETYQAAFSALGYTGMRHLFITRREQSDLPECLDRIERCNCLIFSGGDQMRLSTILGGTQLMARVKQRYLNEPFIIAGTSAGAMAMSTTMIIDGNATRAHLKGEIKFSTGFGFTPRIIIDTHFEKRGRFNRLAQAVAVQPGILGVGLAEDTGVIIYPGQRIEVIGSGIVTVVNGKTIHSTNLADIEDGMPISVEHMIVHILSHGDVYNISEQQLEK
ncbi:MAG TPA: cyanophycinase [Puia sp.]